MNAFENLFIIPMRLKPPSTMKKLFQGDYDFLETSFMLRVAIQGWVDYVVDPESQWFFDIESEIESVYGPIIRKRLGDTLSRRRTVFNKREFVAAKDKIHGQIMDDIINKISNVSNWLNLDDAPFDLYNFCHYSDYELIVDKAWFGQNCVKFIITEY